jgi:hypothetical protein
MYLPWQRLKVSTKYLPSCYNIGDFMHAEIGKDSAGKKTFSRLSRGEKV